MKLGFRTLVLIAATILPVSVFARPKSISAYDGAINFGSQAINSSNGCLFVNGTLSSGNFFRELKRKDSEAGSEYSRNGQAVTRYPETLTASIQILGNQCSHSTSSASAIFSGDSYALTLQVDWKTGMEMRPAALSPVVAHCVGSSALINNSEDVMTVPALTCQVTVDSKGVPLADHLIVSLYGADGQRITRISAAP